MSIVIGIAIGAVAAVVAIAIGVVVWLRRGLAKAPF